MKTEATHPVFPTTWTGSCSGLTKREAFAMAALEGLVAEGLVGIALAQTAVFVADALIEALNGD